MIHFSERLAICDLYDIWLGRHPQVENNPLSVVTFLQVYGLLNEEEFKKVCSEYYRARGGHYEHINN